MVTNVYLFQTVIHPDTKCLIMKALKKTSENRFSIEETAESDFGMIATTNIPAVKVKCSGKLTLSARR